MKNNYNVIITSVGGTYSKRLNFYNDKEDYSGFFISGQITNEAPVKSIILNLAKNKEEVSEIITIESELVRNKRMGMEESCAEIFKKRINALNDYIHRNQNDDSAQVQYTIEMLKLRFKEKNEVFPSVYETDYPSIDGNHSISFHSIEIADEPDEKDVARAIYSINRRLMDLSKVRGKENINIYIESNGGIRYVLTMLLSITKLLEIQHDNIHIKMIPAMVFNPSGKQIVTKIKDSRKVYETSQIPDIVSEFITYGRVNNLRKYYNNRKEEMPDPFRKETDQLIKSFEKVSEDLQLCRTQSVLDDFYGIKNNDGSVEKGLGELIDDYMELINDYIEKRKEEELSGVVIIFANIFETLKNEMSIIYESDNTSAIDSIVYLPRVIRWCNTKDFIQQALTFSVERLPKYLFNSGIITYPSVSNIEETNSEYEKCYEYLTHFFDRKVYRNEILSRIIDNAVSLTSIDGYVDFLVNICDHGFISKSFSWENEEFKVSQRRNSTLLLAKDKKVILKTTKDIVLVNKPNELYRLYFSLIFALIKNEKLSGFEWYEISNKLKKRSPYINGILESQEYIDKIKGMRFDIQGQLWEKIKNEKGIGVKKEDWNDFSNCFSQADNEIKNTIDMVANQVINNIQQILRKSGITNISTELMNAKFTAWEINKNNKNKDKNEKFETSITLLKKTQPECFHTKTDITTLSGVTVNTEKIPQDKTIIVYLNLVDYLIEYHTTKDLNYRYNPNHYLYKSVIGEIWNNLPVDMSDLSADIIAKWIKNSEYGKFFVMDALDLKLLQVKDDKKQNFQYLLYLYSVCKSQRNRSNHASDDKNVLNQKEIKELIHELIEQCMVIY